MSPSRTLVRDYKTGRITLRGWYDRATKASSAASKKTTKIGRDAKTGKFIPVDVARRRPATTTVETIKKSGKK